MERRKPSWLKGRTIEIEDAPHPPQKTEEIEYEEEDYEEYTGHTLNLGTIIGMTIGIVILVVGITILSIIINMETGTNTPIANTVILPTTNTLLGALPALLALGGITLAVGWAVIK